ncbi:MAG TPA: hypothetical protein VH678_20570 [Xanthobacteraceae bacterium]
MLWLLIGVPAVYLGIGTTMAAIMDATLSDGLPWDDRIGDADLAAHVHPRIRSGDQS